MEKKYARQTKLEELREDLQEIARPLLNSGERVITCFSSGTDISGGDWLSILSGGLFGGASEGLHYALILTELQIIVCSGYGPTKHGGAARLIDVVNVTGSTRSSVSSRKGQEEEEYDIAVAYEGDQKLHVTLYSNELGRKCLELLRQAVQRAKGLAADDPQSPPNNLTVEDRLRHLTNLHRENLISDDEFKAKRDEILGEL